MNHETTPPTRQGTPPQEITARQGYLWGTWWLMIAGCVAAWIALDLSAVMLVPMAISWLGLALICGAAAKPTRGEDSRGEEPRRG